MQPSMEYLGHVLDTNGVHIAPSKRRAIAEARAPSNITELRSFLGLVKVLRSFSTKRVHCFASTEPSVEKGCRLVVDQEVPGSISSHQGDVEFGPGPGSL